MTPETYFADSDVPLTVTQEKDHYYVLGKWDNGQQGMGVTFDEQPDEGTLRILHKSFLYDYGLWQQHKDEPPRIR